MIPSETVLIDAKPLGELFKKEVAKLGERASYTQKLELIYTDGKAHQDWIGVDSKAVRGQLIDEQERQFTRTFYAKIVIDYASCAQESLSLIAGGGFSKSKPSPDAIKKDLFNTVCHEYIHALQMWRKGANQSLNEGPSPARKEYRALAAAYQSAVERHPSGNAERDRLRAYLSHPWEQEAERVAHEVTNKLGAAVRKGEWDFLLPLKMLDAGASQK